MIDRRPTWNGNRTARNAEADAAAASSRLLTARIYTLAIVLRRTTNFVTKRELGLSQDAARSIILLGEYQPLLPSDLASHLALDQGQLSRSVSNLVKQGLVSRVRRGRTAELTLTDAGMATFRQLLEAAERRNNELLQDFSATDIEKFDHDLETVILRAEAMYERERALAQLNETDHNA